MDWNEVKWSEVKWNEMKWNEMNWTEMKWNEMKWNEMKWNVLNWTELNWTELNWTELNWTELNWTELNWTELNWTELNWAEPVRFLYNVVLQKKKEQMLLFQFPDSLPTMIFDEEKSNSKVWMHVDKTELISNGKEGWMWINTKSKSFLSYLAVEKQVLERYFGRIHRKNPDLQVRKNKVVLKLYQNYRILPFCII